MTERTPPHNHYRYNDDISHYSHITFVHYPYVVLQLAIVTTAVALWHCSLSTRCTALALASALSGGSNMVREVLALFLASMAASATPGRRESQEGALGGCSGLGNRDGSSKGCGGSGGEAGGGGGGGGNGPGWGWTAAVARGWAASAAPELAVGALAAVSVLLSCTLFVALPVAVPCAR